MPWLQVVLATLLVAAILFQQSEEGLGSAFGGGASGGNWRVKRGLEKKVFVATIVLGILFVITNLLNLFF